MRWYRAPSNVQAEIQRPFLRYLFVSLALRLLVAFSLALTKYTSGTYCVQYVFTLPAVPCMVQYMHTHVLPWLCE